MKWTASARTAPAIAYAVAKAHLRLDTDDDRQTVVDLVEAAADFAEGEIEGTVGVRTITATFWEGDALYLPRGPVRAVTSVTDADARAVSYQLRTVGNADLLELTSAYRYPVTVVYTAGLDPVPGALRVNILRHVADCYDHRTNVGDGKPHPSIERVYTHFRRSAPVS